MNLKYCLDNKDISCYLVYNTYNKTYILTQPCPELITFWIL